LIESYHVDMPYTYW